jgi:hypothetical protein
MRKGLERILSKAYKELEIVDKGVLFITNRRQI